MDETADRKSPRPSKVIFDLNIAVIGEPATGKTAIISRLSGGTFPPFYKPTNGVEQSVATIEIEEGVEANICFWDVSGHERFGTTSRSYCNKCTGFIFVFDCTRDLTLSSLLHWNMDVNANAGNNIYEEVMEGDISKILIANKKDLVKPSQNNLKQEAEMSSFSETCGILESFGCSAKTGLGLDRAIHTLAKKMIENLRRKGVTGRVKTPQKKHKAEKPKPKPQQELGPAPVFNSWRF